MERKIMMRGSFVRRTDDSGNPLPCIIEECPNNIYCKGLCHMHYMRQARHDNPLYDYNESKPCALPNCDRPSRVRTSTPLCNRHYKLSWRYGISATKLIYMFQPENRICSNISCGSRENLHMDHDHNCCAGPPTCGTCNRGWLCHNCNKALGNINDSVEKLQGLIDYLNR